MSKRALAVGSLRWLGPLVFAGACHSEPQPTPSANAGAPPDTSPDFEPAPAAPAKPPGLARELAAASPASDARAPSLAATRYVTPVQARPDASARWLGQLRAGAVVARAGEPVPGVGCAGAWYSVQPRGFVCSEHATLELDAPLVRATARRPALDRPLPYRYGFVRDALPAYLHIPSRQEQRDNEPDLEAQLAWFAEQRSRVLRVSLGANDVPLDARGYPAPGLPLPSGRRLSTQLDANELFAGAAGAGQVPFWLDGSRQIPLTTGGDASSLLAGRVPAKTGLAFVDAFSLLQEGVERGFALTPDLRLIPTSKLQPLAGSVFHGVELTSALALPFAFVSRPGATSWQLVRGRDEARPAAALPYRALVPLTGDLRIKAGARYYQTERDRALWLRAQDIGLVAAPPALPAEAERGERWLDVSLAQQTLVLYRGRVPEYATLISSGTRATSAAQDAGLTPRGAFHIRSKHVTATFDSDEGSTVPGGQRARAATALSAKDQALTLRLLAAEKAGKRLSHADLRRLANIKQGRQPESGRSVRRAAYELEDTPWVQYFEPGYALRGAYWHDDFGTARTRGCIDLSPIDALVLFAWTAPGVPEGWHGVESGDELAAGTLVQVRD
jgi:L,D-transpeptidase-like protein